MARATTQFVCQSCGSRTGKWAGRCDNCGEWNTIAEEAARAPGIAAAAPRLGGRRGRGRLIELSDLQSGTQTVTRLATGIAEFDRVVGGGIVPGSALLLGGDPGIGKSTLLLQVAAMVASAKRRVTYISGEESPDQVRLRAQRLGVETAAVELGAATSVADILTTLETGPVPPSLVIIDSIQTMWDDMVESAPGTVAQVRASSQSLIRFAKERDTAVVLVGHVTKDGQIAGPRVVEHMVDAVLYFEGDRGHRFRILRGVKNRFGPTDEIGVFEMTGAGLGQVENPSALFIGGRDEGAPGAAVFAGIEGTRPILVEIQALVAPSSLGTPRRAVVGADASRLAMIIAVLEARCGVSMAGQDVYLNIAGGLRIFEPAADLAVAAALLSSLTGAALPMGAIHFGEISLSGAVRPVAQPGARLKEAKKLGFSAAIIPVADQSNGDRPAGLDITTIEDLAALVGRIAAAGSQENDRT
ncbi:DNA repair protein RadA [hydrothermal vent metagenome]|uniref:DNA repair protein RadA n=1 Tax=hydrothermal vent metagenome TaxID=652676 RepID=A0A3B0TQN4_9ZZZZ